MNESQEVVEKFDIFGIEVLVHPRYDIEIGYQTPCYVRSATTNSSSEVSVVRGVCFWVSVTDSVLLTAVLSFARQRCGSQKWTIQSTATVCSKLGTGDGSGGDLRVRWRWR